MEKHVIYKTFFKRKSSTILSLASQLKPEPTMSRSTKRRQDLHKLIYVKMNEDIGDTLRYSEFHRRSLRRFPKQTQGLHFWIAQRDAAVAALEAKPSKRASLRLSLNNKMQHASIKQRCWSFHTLCHSMHYTHVLFAVFCQGCKFDQIRFDR